jgi:hypothetical protein
MNAFAPRIAVAEVVRLPAPNSHESGYGVTAPAWRGLRQPGMMREMGHLLRRVVCAGLMVDVLGGPICNFPREIARFAGFLITNIRLADTGKTVKFCRLEGLCALQVAPFGGRSAFKFSFCRGLRA